MEEYAVLNNITIKKTITLERLVFGISLVVSGLSIIYLLLVFILGDLWIPFIEINIDSSKLTLALIQCLIGSVALHMPMLVTKFTGIKFPDTLCTFFYIFIICATTLGEMFSLYYTTHFWDSLLHFASGIMSGMLGSILVVHYCQKKKCGNMITPMFVAIAAICFALSIGLLWEVYEFAGDIMLGLNMQKYLLQDGTELIGQKALIDTMKDLVVDFLGALIAAIAAFISIKQKRGQLYTYKFNEVIKLESKVTFNKGHYYAKESQP